MQGDPPPQTRLLLPHVCNYQYVQKHGPITTLLCFLSWNNNVVGYGMEIAREKKDKMGDLITLVSPFLLTEHCGHRGQRMQSC